jgi:DGQHR domain-containing protein
MIDNRSLSIPILKIRQKKSELYLAALPARDLIEISYADVRRLADEQRDVERYLGIQRPVSPTRIKQIKKYLEAPDARFPTGIIVAVDEKCASVSEDGKQLTLSPYHPEPDSEEKAIPYDKIAKILDGQHRLAGFLSETHNWEFDFPHDEPFELSVVVFVGADLSTQAEIFATVNLAQTKVNKSLVYDLQDLAEARSPFKTSHDVAVALDEVKASPFYKRIKRLGVRTEGRDQETITQAAFVESLVELISFDPVRDRNRLLDGKTLELPTEEDLQKRPFRRLFIERQDLDVVEIVSNYFKAVRRKWPGQWDNPNRKGNIVAKSNAFKAFMRRLRDVYPEASNYSYTTVPSVEKFFGYFSHIALDDEAFNTSTFVPGSSGQSVFYKLLTGEVSGDELIEASAPPT